MGRGRGFRPGRICPNDYPEVPMCRPNVIALVLALAALGWALPVAAQAADLIVLADRVWTGDEMPPCPRVWQFGATGSWPWGIRRLS